jgi:hypothetical protein
VDISELALFLCAVCECEKYTIMCSSTDETKTGIAHLTGVTSRKLVSKIVNLHIEIILEYIVLIG